MALRLATSGVHRYGRGETTPWRRALLFLFDREDDLASDVTTGGPFVRPPRVRERERTVYRDPNRTSVKQAPDFCELRATRAHLGHRDRDTPLGSLSSVSETRKHWKQGAPTLERSQKATRGRAAHRVEDEIEVTDLVLGQNLGVVDELVGAEFPQESLLLARSNCDDVRALPFRQLNRNVSHAARGAVDQDSLTLERHGAMWFGLQRVWHVVPLLDQELPRGKP